jgi:rhamnosyltransferase
MMQMTNLSTRKSSPSGRIEDGNSLKPLGTSATGHATPFGVAEGPARCYPTKSKICAVIVTYRPEYDGQPCELQRDRQWERQASVVQLDNRRPGCHADLDFRRCFRITAAQVDELLIIDNGSEPNVVNLLLELRDELKAHLVLNQKNMGIASALNRGVEWAIAEGAEWVLTLDQDSVPAPDMVPTLISAYERFPERSKVAVIGSNYHKLFGELATVPTPESETVGWQEMTTVISSGSLISVQRYSVIGPFRDDFFMDCVDLEYCLRARSKGFRIMMTTKPLMIQRIGDPSEHRFLGRRVVSANYSPERRFYMSRNHFIIARDYLFQEPRWVLSTLWRRFKTLVGICLIERDRIAKLRAAWRGTIAGAFSRTQDHSIQKGLPESE